MMFGFDDFAHLASFLLVSAFSLWAVGALAALVSGEKASDKLFSTIFGAGSALLTTGVMVVWPSVSAHQQLEWVAKHPIYLGLAPFANHLDTLSALFLLLLGVVGISIAFFSPGYMHHLQGRVNKGLYWTCLFLFVIGMGQVILAANALTFLVFWEIMSLSSVALVASDPVKHRSQRAALIYLGATRVATAFLTGGFLWLHYLTNSWNFSDWTLTAIPMVPVLIIFIGFAIKAGCFPFHIWLPYAHPEAPSPVSALMSGVMVKVAIYGMIRLLIMNDCTSLFIGYCALIVGVISAVWGVLFGLMEHDLKRLLAYSTVENVGLLVTGIGLALLCKCTAHPVIAAYALTGVLFHVINHGLFKSLLFLGAGAVDTQARTRDLTFLGGLAKNMPWTMTCFFVGSVAICALPPLNGFASKWLLYQSFFQLSFHADSIVDRGMALTVVGVMSVVGALSLATFAKAVGIGFLGRPRSESAFNAAEATQGMVFAQMFLAVMCILLGVWASPALHQFAPVCQDGLQYPIDPAVLFTIPQMLLAMLGLLTVFVVYSVVFGSSLGLREYITWDCGYGDLPARAEETGSSFSQPIGRIFRPLLQYKMSTEIKGRDRRHFPEWIKVEVQMLPALEYYIYNPLIGGLQRFAKLLVRLQTASIHIHLLYVFMTMLILVCVGISL
jgi:formate hydrogenlyase subunit 3/multisubunit Na+/H+ antiporter MnhD subunit